MFMAVYLMRVDILNQLPGVGAPNSPPLGAGAEKTTIY